VHAAAIAEEIESLVYLDTVIFLGAGLNDLVEKVEDRYDSACYR
jgi:hypothetical protein